MASAKDAKLLKQTKFPPEFNQKVDMQKVNIEVMKKWIAGKISEILGNEDDVVIELCFNLLEASRYPDIKDLQIKLTGFLDKDTAKFCKELWNLCLSAQGNPQGVPKELLEAKKLELIQEKIDAEKSAEATKKRKEEETQRDRNIEDVRQRERNERGYGRGRGGRESFPDRRPRYSRSPPSRDFGRRRYSRSPPRRRASPPPRDDYYRGPSRRDIDTYVPGGRRDRYDDRRRPYSPHRRSLTPSSRSSRSVSPAPQRRGSPPLERSERGRRSPPARGDHRTRSYSSSEASHSRSPRRSRNPPPRSDSRSPSPRRNYNHRRRRNTSSSPSRSLSVTRRQAPKRRGRSPSYSSDSGDDRRDSRADFGKGRYRRHSRDRRPPHKAGSRSRSASRTPELPRKRHRSLERYKPAARRRRNTSPNSSPVDRKKQKTADGSEDGFQSSRKQRETGTHGRLLKEEENPQPQATPTRGLTESQLKEKLLKEKVIAMRRQSTNGGRPAMDSLAKT